jgi:DNA-binding transcriptional LysR family regulator
MKLQHLRFFVAVVESGGVVRAAERLHVSQPAVSAGLKALEQELGGPLLERAGRGRHLRPTSKGLRFHRSALAIVRQCNEARAEFQNQEAKPAKLRVGVLHTIASTEVAMFTAALADQKSSFRMQLTEGGPARLAELLRAGRIDVAWTIVDRNGAQACALWREPFVMFTSRSQRFGRGRRRKISLSDLDGEGIILRTCCEMRRGQLWPESVRMRVAARTERDELMLQLTAQGIGIAIAPRGLATDRVVARKIHDLNVTRSIGVKWRAETPEGMVAAILDALKAVKRRDPI